MTTKNTISFQAIGTTWDIQIYDSTPTISIDKLKKQILQRVKVFDKTYSRFREDSFLFGLSKKSGSYVMPEDGYEIFSLFYKLYKLTDGVFTPLIGKQLEEIGYDRNYSLEPKKISKVAEWDEVLEFNEREINVKEPVLLDLGAAGKGYLVDIIAEIIANNHIERYLVNGSGDIYYGTNTDDTLTIGLEHPHDVSQVIGIKEIKNESICASAGNRRKWNRYHHIFNPKTLDSNKEILSTWVVAENTILADALATALFLVEPNVLEKNFKCEYLILNKDYSIERSEGFGGELFVKEGE